MPLTQEINTLFSDAAQLQAEAAAGAIHMTFWLAISQQQLLLIADDAHDTCGHQCTCCRVPLALLATTLFNNRGSRKCG
jgi:putative intracellular protease/amidase